MVRREHVLGAPIAKSVIGALTIAGGPVDCYDELLQNTEDAEVAADCFRVKEDLRSLCRAAHTYDHKHGDGGSLVGFLEETRVEPAGVLTSEEDTRLTISTIHGAKGTEAQEVFLIGCEERLLPIGYAIDSVDPLRIEEERRLFYVAATRAKDRLTLTTAAERLGKPTRGPSRFLRRPADNEYGVRPAFVVARRRAPCQRCFSSLTAQLRACDAPTFAGIRAHCGDRSWREGCCSPPDERKTVPSGHTSHGGRDDALNALLACRLLMVGLERCIKRQRRDETVVTGER